MKHLLFLIIALSLLSCVTSPAPEQVESAGNGETYNGSMGTEEDKGREASDQAENRDPEGQGSDDGEENQTAPPLTLAEIVKYVKSRALPGYFPVQREGAIVWTAYDLYGNGLDDFFVLFVEADKPEEAEVELLSDMENLYSPSSVPPRYYLQAFLQEPGRIFEGKREHLSKKQVFSSLSAMRISIQRRRPFAVLAEFLTPESIRTEWIIYSNDGISRFTTARTLTVTPRIDDIDGNGLVDVVVQEKILEEGTGFETFLTWYRWNGEGYQEYKTTNVVRNLKKFFAVCEKSISAGDWKGFCRFALGKRDLTELLERGLSYPKIMDRILSPSAEEDEEKPPSLSSVPDVTSIVFPQLMEDPFLLQRGRSLFPLFVKVVSGEDSYLYHGTILLNDNPFSDPQFSFLIN